MNLKLFFEIRLDLRLDCLRSLKKLFRDDNLIITLWLSRRLFMLLMNWITLYREILLLFLFGYISYNYKVTSSQFIHYIQKMLTISFWVSPLLLLQMNGSRSEQSVKPNSGSWSDQLCSVLQPCSSIHWWLTAHTFIWSNIQTQSNTQ